MITIAERMKEEVARVREQGGTAENYFAIGMTYGEEWARREIDEHPELLREAVGLFENPDAVRGFTLAILRTIDEFRRGVLAEQGDGL